MRVTLTLILVAVGVPASAHVGHIADVAGHGHWIALGAIGLAAAVGLLGGKAKKDDEVADEEADEAEEQPA